ncbi:leucine-rich repeat protein, partial [Bifidobacterium panos]
MMRHLSQDGLKRRGVVQRVLLMLVAVAMVVPLTLVAGQAASADTVTLDSELICELNADGTAKITKYNPTSATGKDIKIPATINRDGKDYTITEIGDSVFAGQQLTAVSFAADSKITKIGNSAFQTNGFTSISLPNTLETIGTSVFQSCGQLASVDLSNTQVTVIPDGTFSGCSKLTSTVLNDQTTSIGANAFYNAPIAKLEIPSTIQSIGGNAFLGNSGPRRVVIKHVPDSTIVAGSLTVQAGVVVWENTSVTAVDNSCFWFDQNTGVILGLKEANHDNCAHPEYHKANASLVIPAQIGGKDVTAIGPGVFCDKNRNNIVSLSFEQGSRVTSIGESAFYSCLRLASLSLPDSLKSIDTSAFFTTPSLSEVLIPASVTTIGENAFRNSSLLKVTFAKGSAISDIGEQAFSVCQSLAEIDISSKEKDSVSGAPWGAQYASVKWANGTDDPQVVSVTGEDGSVWEYNTVSKTLVSYEGANGTGSEDLKVPSKVTWTDSAGVKQEASPTSIGGSAVSSKGSFKSVTIPSNITTIESSFQDTQIKSLILEEGIESIGYRAFQNCGLTEVTLPQSLTNIGTQSFVSNDLTELTIPRKVTSLASDAFTGNKNLTMITVDQCRLSAMGGYPLVDEEMASNQPWSGDADVATRIAVLYKDDAQPLIVPDTEANRAIKSQLDDAKLDTDMSHAVAVDPATNTVSVKVISRMNLKGSSVKLDSLTVDGVATTDTQKDSQSWLSGSKTGITKNGTVVTFVSSFTDADDGNKVKTVTQTVTVDAFHTVKYDANAPEGHAVTGSAPTDSTSYVEGYQVTTKDSNNMKVLVNGAEAYDFLGWSTKPDATEPDYEAGDKMEMPAEDTTLYAVWKLKPISFTLDANGGMFDETETKTTLSLKGDAGSSLNSADGYAEPTREGYVFKGWNTNPKATEPSTVLPIAADTTYYAVWAEDPNITVTFDANGGQLTGDATSTGTYGSALTAPTVSRAGYEFKGWNTSADGKGTAFQDKYPAKSVTYKAVWNPVQTTVAFSAGEGDNKHGELTATTPSSLLVTTEKALSTDSNYPVENGPMVTPDAGWRFLYWQSSVTDADKNETLGPVYQPSQIADLKAQAGLKFTAVYEQLPEVSVVYNFNGGHDADNNTSVTLKGVDGTEYTDEAKAKVPDTSKLTRTGYTFKEWSPAVTGKYASVTYTAQWTANTNNVNFVVSDEDKHGSLTGNTEYRVLTGEKVGGKPTVTADGGYRFVGWVSSENQKVYSQDSVDAYVVSGANPKVTFTAKFVPESSVEVHYNYAGGYNKNNDSSLVLNGLEGAEYSDADKTAAAEEPTRTGYTFKQWDKALSTTYQSVTYTAEWTVNPNTVTFLPGDNGTLDGTTQYTVNSGEKVTGEPTANATAGWTFVGWKSSEDGLLYGKDGVKGKYVVSGLNPEVTFTARYEPNNGAKAVFNANGGLIDQKDSSVTREGKQGETYAKPSNPTREGYTFVKWQDADGNEPSGTYASDGTTVYVAQWEADSYGVSFKQGDHGALTGTTDYQVATDAKLGDAGVVAPKVESEAGWSLVGWQSEEYGLVTSDQLASLVMPAKGVEFTAQYAQNATATVTFSFDGGTDAAGNAWTMLSGPLGTKYDVPANPTKDGYTFKQWDKQVTGTFDEASLQVTAQWTANENTLTFNKGDHGTLTGTTGYTVATDASLKDAKVTAPEVACEAGWSFVGWLSDEFGLVTSDELASLTMPGKNVTLTAQYVQNATGVVVFAYNGGTDKDGNASNIQSGALGTAYTAPADPTRTGYTFTGWDRDASGTFKQSMLQVNATWKANTYKITYKLDGGTDPKNPASYTYGVGATLKNPTRDGYTFAGWADAKGNLVSGISASDTGDKTLTAKWTKNASTDGLNPDGGTIPSDWTGSDGQLPIPTRDGYKFDGW